MKTLVNFWAGLVTWAMISFMIASGVFIGLLWYGSSQNHILVEFQEFKVGEDQSYFQIDVVPFSPFHQSDEYHLYLIDDAYTKNENGDWEPTTWMKLVQEGRRLFTYRTRDESLLVFWYLVCSKSELHTYEDVRLAAQNPYVDNKLHFSQDYWEGYKELDCSR